MNPPATRDECSRCGTCCKSIPCGIALALLCDRSPCPALEEVGGIYQCGMMVKPSRYIDIGGADQWKDDFLGKMFADMLGAGMGCCTSPQTEAIGDKMREAFAKKNSRYRGMEVIK